jgi:hypothetical protein
MFRQKTKVLATKTMQTELFRRLVAGIYFHQSTQMIKLTATRKTVRIQNMEAFCGESDKSDAALTRVVHDMGYVMCCVGKIQG